MRTWMIWTTVVAAGCLAACVAVSGLGPLAAFFGAGFAALAACLAVRRLAPLGEVQQFLPPLPQGDPGEPDSEAQTGRALIERLPVPLIILSHNGRLVNANPAAKATLPRLETGQHFAHIIRTPAFVEAMTATLDDGRDRTFEFSFFDGSERHFEARASLLDAVDWFGPDARALVQVEDRTKSHRSEQLRSDFIANASHELRTPLASIIGYIETLQNHAREDSAARERFLAVMAREAHRMQRLVDDLMSLSRIEMNEHVRPEERVSLNRIAIDCASVFLPLAKQEGIALSVDLEPEGGEVIGDRDQLSQVFTNLIDNAMKHGGSGCAISVRAASDAKAHPNRVGVSVSDTGPGIPRDKIHRLTERFYRVNVSQSRSKGGTGLGLAIVKHILNRHRGRIEVVSTEGSTFTVWLPRAAPVPAAAPGPALEPIPEAPRRQATN